MLGDQPPPRGVVIYIYDTGSTPWLGPVMRLLREDEELCINNSTIQTHGPDFIGLTSWPAKRCRGTDGTKGFACLVGKFDASSRLRTKDQIVIHGMRHGRSLVLSILGRIRFNRKVYHDGHSGFFFWVPLSLTKNLEHLNLALPTLLSILSSSTNEQKSSMSGD